MTNIYDDFWALYAERDPDVLEDRTYGRGRSNRDRIVHGTGIIIARHFSPNGTKTVGIYLKGETLQGQNPEVRAMLEEALGVRVDATSFHFHKKRPIDLQNSADVAAAIAWLVVETQRYEAAIEHSFKRAPTIYEQGG